MTTTGNGPLPEGKFICCVVIFFVFPSKFGLNSKEKRVSSTSILPGLISAFERFSIVYLSSGRFIAVSIVSKEVVLSFAANFHPIIMEEIIKSIKNRNLIPFFMHVAYHKFISGA